MQPPLDLILMTLVIFVPSVFALGLLFFPAGRDEESQARWKDYMRWWSLIGTALTLGISVLMLILFYQNVIDRHLSGETDRSLLGVRAADVERGVEGTLKRSDDWVEKYPWISRFNIDYYLGVDGISMPLILLTTVISFLAMIASWNIERYVRGYCILFLLLETGMVGTFLALDFFLFYVFWEVMLLPMYFLIGVWGGPRREYAAIKFFLYTLLGSVFILIALLGFYFTDIRDFVPTSNLSGPQEYNSFDLVALQRAGKAASQILHQEFPEKVAGEVLRAREVSLLSAEQRRELASGTPVEQERIKQLIQERIKPYLPEAVKRLTQQSFFQPWFQYTMFLLLLVGFAIKVPVFPFHTWLPDAHVEAPTPISMILAGVLLKMGGYGIIRIAYPICPWAAEMLAWWVALFGVINIVYGALAAMAQTDFKKLVAYSSISHMGYVVLGVAVWAAADRSQYWAWGMNGAMFQMIAHGISSPGMFFLVGVIYDRAHHRNLDNYRGLYEPMPLYSAISAVIFQPLSWT